MHREKNKSGQNPSLTNTTTKPDKSNELHAAPAGRESKQSASRTDTPSEKGSGKRDIREPESPRREEEIREPNLDEQETDDAGTGTQDPAAARKQNDAAIAAQRRESHREAAIEENPPRDPGDLADEDAA